MFSLGTDRDAGPGRGGCRLDLRGKRHSESLGKVTWNEAKDRRREKEANLANGTELLDRPDRMTVAGLVEYHRQAIKLDVRPSTAAGYEPSYSHIRRVLGDDKAIERISPADVGRIKSNLSERGCRHATIHKTVGHLRSMLNLAVRDQLLARNPLNALKLGRVEPKSARVYSKADARALVAAASSQWWRTFVKLGFTAGLRLGELSALEWADVDLDAGLMHVRPKQAGTFTMGGETLPRLPWSPKSAAGTRTVPIPEDTLGALRALKRQADGSPCVFLDLPRLRRIRERMAAGTWTAEAPVLNNVLRDFKVLHKAAKLPDPVGTVGTVHDLRKSYCTAMAAVVPMHVLQKWAGHSNIATTGAFYCRVQDHDAELARDAMRDETPDLRLVG